MAKNSRQKALKAFTIAMEKLNVKEYSFYLIFFMFLIDFSNLEEVD